MKAAVLVLRFRCNRGCTAPYERRLDIINNNTLVSIELSHKKSSLTTMPTVLSTLYDRHRQCITKAKKGRYILCVFLHVLQEFCTVAHQEKCTHFFLPSHRTIQVSAKVPISVSLLQ